MEKTLDSRRARSEATKSALMRAAEKLIAERGVENVSIREIVSAAQQKNESALQYHFKNLSGLLSAIHEERTAQIQTRRAELLEALLTTNPKPSLRQLSRLMFEPIFQLARGDVAIRRYVQAFGHELVMADASPLKLVSRQGGGGASGAKLGALLKEALPHLSAADYRRRMEAAVVLCSASMYRQARAQNAFRGPQSELFFNHLLDAVVGLLSAPVSPETLALSTKR